MSERPDVQADVREFARELASKVGFAEAPEIVAERARDVIERAMQPWVRRVEAREKAVLILKRAMGCLDCWKTRHSGGGECREDAPCVPCAVHEQAEAVLREWDAAKGGK